MLRLEKVPRCQSCHVEEQELTAQKMTIEPILFLVRPATFVLSILHTTVEIKRVELLERAVA